MVQSTRNENHACSSTQTNGNILLVDNDNGYFEVDVDIYYEEALTLAGYTFDEWDVYDHGDTFPASEEMQQYDAVVWFTGQRFGGSLPTTAQESLSNYLESEEGGRLFLSSQDVGNEIYYTSFYSTYLRAEYLGSFYVDEEGQGQGGFRIQGENQDCIGGGMSSHLTWVNFHDDDDYRPDWISPLPGASSCFYYTDLDSTLLKGGIKSDFPGGTRVIYLSFALETIDNLYDRSTILGRSLAWLCENESPLTVEINNPETGIVGQALQMIGTANGGIAPYYSWYWDFGDGFIYQGKEVSHVYDAPGEYVITLTVKDSAYPQHTVSVQRYVTVDYDSLLEVTEITNRILKIGVSMVIQNTGDYDATDVEMILKISGGVTNQIDIQVSDWNAVLQPGESMKLNSTVVFGFGLINIKATGKASNAILVTRNTAGFIIGPFVIIDRESV